MERPRPRPRRPRSYDWYSVILMETLERRRVLAAGHLDPGFATDSPLAREISRLDTPLDRQVYVDLQPLPNGQILTLRTHLGMAVADDGRDYVRDFSASVRRFNADGSLDPTFGTGCDARVGWNGNPAHLLLQPDGKIITYDDFGWHLTRLNPDGSHDTSFGNGGEMDWQADPAFASLATVVEVAPAPDGGLVFAAISYDSAAPGGVIARTRPDGTPDPSFGNGGRVALGPETFFMPTADLAVLPDGSILLDNAGVFRKLTPAGAPDPDFTPFAPGGPVPALGDFFVQPDGKIVVISLEDGGLIRLNPDGTVDPTYHRAGGPDGPRRTHDGSRHEKSELPAVTNDDEWDVNEFSPTRLLRQADGKAVLVGLVSLFEEDGSFDRSTLVVGRYNTDGTTDRTFAYQGNLQIDYADYDRSQLGIAAAAIGTDGRIWVAPSALDWTRYPPELRPPETPHVRELVRVTADADPTPATNPQGGFFELPPPPRDPSFPPRDSEETPPDPDEEDAQSHEPPIAPPTVEPPPPDPTKPPAAPPPSSATVFTPRTNDDPDSETLFDETDRSPLDWASVDPLWE